MPGQTNKTASFLDGVCLHVFPKDTSSLCVFLVICRSQANLSGYDGNKGNQTQGHLTKEEMLYYFNLKTACFHISIHQRPPNGRKELQRFSDKHTWGHLSEERRVEI